MASPAHWIAAAAPTTLPDELLEEIFLLLEAPADLARASSTCTAFRRVVSGRRFRSLHPPPAADFTFSFLPAPNDWRVCDALDARVLLRRRPGDAAAFADLVVCDPLHRRYVQVPPIPYDLAVSTGAPGMTLNCFLDPASEEKREDEDDVSFGVICAVHFQHKLVTFRFSSVTGKWRALTFDRELSLPTIHDVTLWSGLFKQQYVHGCFYWRIPGVYAIIQVQCTREMRLRQVEIPTVTYRQQKVFVEVGEGRLGLLVLHVGILDLYCKTLRDHCIGTEEWQHDRTIPLPKLDSTWSWWIVGADKRYVLLGAILLSRSWLQNPPAHYFTLDLKTFLFESLSVSNQLRSAYLYASFPPSLSLPSI
ncbi:hypothetical protein HU200_039742 [Digitaria exilis]|uniref:F-box domain-containing protein n=1 Tax=Digitaria exilis TaxID=1010633 RepID=A0A835EH12_9POAL|nr:hypothetical protein HU200_039742 [Digitaria exilis]